MAREMKIGNKVVGDGHPTYVIAEIGINHNGDVDLAKQMIDAAVAAEADAVKFQKRTPEVCTPPDQQKQMRETPWGYITYLDYRYKVEFDLDAYREWARAQNITNEQLQRAYQAYRAVTEGAPRAYNYRLRPLGTQPQ